METKVVEKIPLLRMRSEKTNKRILNVFGNRSCVVYSKKRDKYKKGDEWVDDIEYADIMTFEEHYGIIKEKIERHLYMYIIKIV